jgi:hypothetical protein
MRPDVFGKRLCKDDRSNTIFLPAPPVLPQLGHVFGTQLRGLNKSYVCRNTVLYQVLPRVFGDCRPRDFGGRVEGETA